MTESLTQRTVRGAAWLGGVSVVRLGLRIISVTILARLLTPEDYGIIAAAMIVLEFATMISTLGLAHTLIQSKNIQNGHVSIAFGLSLVTALINGILIWLTAPFVAKAINIIELENILRVLSFLPVFGAFNTLCEALLARNMKAKAVALRQLLSFALAAFVVAVPMAYSEYGYWSLVAMQATEGIASGIILGIVARKWLVMPGFSMSAFRELWRISFGYYLNQPLLYFTRNIDKYLVGRLMGVEHLGFYNRASFVTTTAMNLFANIARMAIFPAMAKVQGDNKKLRNAFQWSLNSVAYLTLPVSAFCFVFAEDIVNVLLGGQWGVASVPFSILSIMLYFKLGWRTCSVLFQGTGQPYRLLIVQALDLLLVTLGVLLAIPYGLAAVCELIVAASFVIYIIILIMSCKQLDLSLLEISRLHLTPAILAIVTASLSYGVKCILVGQSCIIQLCVGIASVAIFHLLLLYYKPYYFFGFEGVYFVRSSKLSFLLRRR